MKPLSDVFNVACQTDRVGAGKVKAAMDDLNN